MLVASHAELMSRRTTTALRAIFILLNQRQVVLIIMNTVNVCRRYYTSNMFAQFYMSEISIYTGYKQFMDM